MEYRLTPITESAAETTLRQLAAAQDVKLRLIWTDAELDANSLIIRAFVHRVTPGIEK